MRVYVRARIVCMCRIIYMCNDIYRYILTYIYVYIVTEYRSIHTRFIIRGNSIFFVSVDKSLLWSERSYRYLGTCYLI